MAAALGQGLLQEPEGILRNSGGVAAPEEAAEAAPAARGGAAPAPDARVPMDPRLLRSLQLGIDGPKDWSAERKGLWDGLFVVGMLGGAWMGATIWQYFDGALAVVAGWQIAACLMTVQVCLGGCRIIREDLGEKGLLGQLFLGEASATSQAALLKTLSGMRFVQHAFSVGTVIGGLWILTIVMAGEPACGTALQPRHGTGCSVNLGPVCSPPGSQSCVQTPDGTCSGAFPLPFALPENFR